jgi:hypothetical protein
LTKSRSVRRVARAHLDANGYTCRGSDRRIKKPRCTISGVYRSTRRGMACDERENIAYEHSSASPMDRLFVRERTDRNFRSRYITGMKCEQCDGGGTVAVSPDDGRYVCPGCYGSGRKRKCRSPWTVVERRAKKAAGKSLAILTEASTTIPTKNSARHNRSVKGLTATSPGTRAVSLPKVWRTRTSSCAARSA